MVIIDYSSNKIDFPPFKQVDSPVIMMGRNNYKIKYKIILKLYSLSCFHPEGGVKELKNSDLTFNMGIYENLYFNILKCSEKSANLSQLFFILTLY